MLASVDAPHASRTLPAVRVAVRFVGVVGAAASRWQNFPKPPSHWYAVPVHDPCFMSPPNHRHLSGSTASANGPMPARASRALGLKASMNSPVAASQAPMYLTLLGRDEVVTGLE